MAEVEHPTSTHFGESSKKVDTDMEVNENSDPDTVPIPSLAEMDTGETSTKTDEDSSNNKKSQKRPLEEEKEPVLVRIRNGSNDHVKDIHIDKDEFSIGRSRDVDVPILSVYISRIHCRLKRSTGNEWTVISLGSTPTKLNNDIIPRGESRPIKVNDVLQLGDITDYTYVFTLRDKCDTNAKRSCTAEKTEYNNALERQKTQFAETQANLKKDLENKLNVEKQKQTELQEQLEDLLERQKKSVEDDEKLKEQIQALEKKIELGSEAEQALRQKYEQMVAQLEEEKRKFEEKLAEEKQKWEEKLENTRKEKETLEAAWTAKEAEWRSKIDEAVNEEKSVREKLLNEKIELEEKMKKLEEAIKEKERSEQVALQNLQAGTSIDLTNNCVVFEVKESGSIEILETIDLTGADVPNQQPQQYEVVNDIMEEQLSCSICSELLVSAMTLNCSHTFCHYCILSWMQKSKHCPNCRAVIKSMIKSLVLDNFIQTMVESVSADQKQRRAELINTRTKLIPGLQLGVMKKHR